MSWRINIMSFDNLGDRMKGYEDISRYHLTKRLPTIIRIDGKAFHSFTKGFQRPFDPVLAEAMEQTCKILCGNIMGCKIAYTQSDEISLLLVNYESLNTQPWFDNNLQKMVSVSASMATMAFNAAFREIFRRDWNCYFVQQEPDVDMLKLAEIYKRRLDTAMFDSRVFVIPKEEVCNYFIWRQQDASRNSIQMVARSKFSHKQLDKKNCSQIQEMLFTEHNLNWNDFPIDQKRGRCIVKQNYLKDEFLRSRWIVDRNIPIFTQDRDYIEKFVVI